MWNNIVSNTFTSLFMNPKCTHPTHTFSFFLQFFFLTLTHQLLNNVITISHHHPATPSHCVVAPPSRCTTATTSLWRCCVVLVLIVATLIDLSCYSLLCHPIATSPLCSSTSSYFFFVPFEIGTPEFSLYPMFYLCVNVFLNLVFSLSYLHCISLSEKIVKC